MGCVTPYVKPAWNKPKNAGGGGTSGGGSNSGGGGGAGGGTGGNGTPAVPSGIATPPVINTGTPPAPYIIRPSYGSGTSNPIENYCGDISGLACAANFTQDVATLIDLVAVGLIEAPAVAIGCIEGGPLGCAIAEVGVIVTWNLTLNNAETLASTASLVFTAADDLFNNGGLGENSATSLATWGAGLIPLTPSWDLALDSYASGYNHGFFNGIYTILPNGPFK